VWEIGGPVNHLGYGRMSSMQNLGYDVAGGSGFNNNITTRGDGKNRRGRSEVVWVHGREGRGAKNWVPRTEGVWVTSMDFGGAAPKTY